MNIKSVCIKMVYFYLAVASFWANGQEESEFQLIYQNYTEAPGNDLAQQLFKEAMTTGDFWSSIRYFVTQKELSYCAIARNSNSSRSP